MALYLKPMHFSKWGDIVGRRGHLYGRATGYHVTTKRSFGAKIVVHSGRDDERRELMSDLETRIAALENEKRKLLESWQREREAGARRQGACVSSFQMSSTRFRRDTGRCATSSRLPPSHWNVRMQASTLARYADVLTQIRMHALEQELALSQKDAEWTRQALAKERETAAAARAELYARASQAEASKELAEQARSTSAAQLAHAERLLTESQLKVSETTRTITELRARLSDHEKEALVNRAASEQATRLADARVERAERRAQELEESCDMLVKECAHREQTAQAERDAAIAEKEQLSSEKARLQAAMDHFMQTLGVDDHGVAATPSRAASLAAQVQRDGKKFSDVYVDLLRSEEELRAEREETMRLESVLAEVMADLDAHAPQLKAQRLEAAQLREDLDAATDELERAAQTREAAEHAAQDATAELDRVRREYDLVSQQLDDASAQVRALLRENILLKDPSAAARLDEDASPDDSGSVQDMITEELVTFRSLTELCSQNARLLQTVRELGQRLEARDPRDDEVQRAADMLEKLTEELSAERAALVDARRERDVYRNVCVARGLDVSDDTPAPPPQAEPPAPPAVLADLQRETSARAAAEERAKLLQDTMAYQEKRLADALSHAERMHAMLEKRDDALRDVERQLAGVQAAAHEAQTALAARDAECRLLGEQRDRLLDENAKLGVARAEAEAAARHARDTDAQSALQSSSRTEQLQAELLALRTAAAEHESKLAEARAEAAHASLRRDVECRELRERLDALMQQHTSAREALATAQAQAQHHERRADDLVVQLEHARGVATLLEKQHAAAEESRRAAVSAALGGVSDPQLTPERQLEMELTDVRRGRAAAEAETLAAKAAQQAAEAAQAHSAQELAEAKAALEAAHAAKDTMESEHKAAVQEKAAHADELQAKITALESDVQSLRSELDAQAASHAAEKRELEDTLAGLNGAETEAAKDEASAWDEVRKFSAQAKEATARADELAQAKAAREQELAHATQELQRVRDELEKMRSTNDRLVVEHTQSLAAAEDKVRELERAGETLRRERDELEQQNTQLHEHLEGVTKQVATLASSSWEAPLALPGGDEKPADGATAAGGDDDGPQEDGQQDAGSAPKADGGKADGAPATLPTTGELQVIRYLRREKELKELQLDMAVQERTRVEQALAASNKALEDARAQLAERETASQPGGQYAELLDKINELSALREHVTTLTEAKNAVEARNQTLEAQWQQAQTEMKPHREALHHAQVELETTQSRMRVMQEDLARWKTRAAGLLQSSGVAEELQKLEKERAEAQTQIQAAQSELESERTRLTAELQAAHKKFEQLREQVRARITQERRAVAEAVERAAHLEKEMNDKAAAAEEEKAALQAQIEQLTTQVQKAQETADAPAESKDDSTPAEGKESEAAAEPKKEDAAAEPKNDDAAAAPTHEDASASAAAQAAEPAAAPAQPDTSALEEQLRIKTEECEKHKHFARTFLKEKRAAEAQVKTLTEELAKASEAQGAAQAAALPKHEAAPSDAAPAQEAAAGQDAPVKAEATEAATEPAQDAADTAALRRRIAELEELLSQANAKVHELEQELDNLKKESAAKLAEQTTELEQLRAGPEAAIAAKEAELQAHYQPLLQSRYEDGKKEAALRNQIMVGQRDKKITNLTNELNELKAQLAAEPNATAQDDAKPAPAAAPVATPSKPPASDTKDATPAGNSTRPAVVRGATPARGGKGGAVTPKPVPIRPAAEGTSIRGAAALRGTATRGRGAAASAGSAKRKRELNTSTSSEGDKTPTKAAAAKKSRADGKEPAK